MILATSPGRQPAVKRGKAEMPSGAYRQVLERKQKWERAEQE